MNTTLKNYGLPARQQTIHRYAGTRVRYSPKRFFFLILLALAGVVAISCRQDTHGQDRASSEASTSQDSVKSDNAKPNTRIRVNRTYDDKGNLIGFDSTYSSYYSNIHGDTSRMDSLMDSFNSFFDRDHSRFFNRQFNTLFFNDSLRYPDFFHNDFFMKRYELNDAYLRDMMRRMDSVKNKFYRDAPKASPKHDET